MKQLGGEDGALALIVGDQARFTAGENVLLFLEASALDDTLRTAGLWRGKWTIDRRASDNLLVAVRRDPGDRRGIFGEPETRQLGPLLRQFQEATPDASSRSSSSRRYRTLPRVMPDSTGATATPISVFSYRWHEADTLTPVAVDFDSRGDGHEVVGGGLRETLAGLTWLNNVGSSMRLSQGVLRGPRCAGTFEGDGRISITYQDPCHEVPLPAGGIGAVWVSRAPGGDPRIVNGVRFSRIVQGTVVLRDAGYIIPPACYEIYLLHEIGHTLGLDHVTDAHAIMNPNYTDSAWAECFTNGNVFTGSDPVYVSNLRFIYPPTVTALPGAPTNLLASPAGSTVNLTWSAPAGAPVLSYVIEAGSATGLSNLASFSTGTTATTFSASGVGAGTYYVRTKAMNSAGTSGASNEVILVVGSGPCGAAPAAPNSLTSTTVGTTVTLRWNAAPGASSYVIEAGSARGLSNIANSDTGTTATILTAGGVGSGAYYARVRAKNACGVSGQSNEIVVTVP